MEINKNCNLVLNDIYVYDIEKCHYSILNKFGYNIDYIDKNDKESRNIQIGYLMKNNPNLTHILRLITKSLVDEFILQNNIKENEIISRQYDGLLITRPVKIVDQFINFNLRDIYLKMIISINRDNYICINNKNKVIVKGISNKYENINNIYLNLLNINYMSKRSIFNNLQRIKNNIIYNENSELFCIPDKNNKFIIYLKQFGQFKISETIINLIDIDEIDKEWYFKEYLKPFFDSIVLEYI